MKITSAFKFSLPVLLFIACKSTDKIILPTQLTPNDVVAANIDLKADPRTDFFQYANGGWLKAHPIPASESSWGIGKTLQEDLYTLERKISQEAANTPNKNIDPNTQKIGDFWATGMDTLTIEKQGIQPLQKEYDRIKAIKDVHDFLSVIALYQTYNIGPLFSLQVYQDEKQSDVYSFHLWQGGLGLPDRDYYTNTDDRNTKIRAEYVKHIANLFTLAGESPSHAQKNSLAVMQIETDLAKASRIIEDLRDPIKNYNKMSIAQLQKLTPSLHWKTMLQEIGVPSIDSVIVGQPEFYEQVERSLKTVPIEDWKSYLRWQLLSNFAPQLSKKFDNESFHFNGVILAGKVQQKERWKRILDAQESALGDALGTLFVKAYFSQATKKRYSDMVDNVLEAYKDRLNALTWISPETKTKALLKLSKVVKKVGYPEKFKDFTAMHIDRSSYAGNAMNAAKWRFHYNLNKLGKPVDRSEWEMTPQTYNAYYNPSNNEIVLPAAQFLIPSFPDSLVDDAVAYGYSAASTIGHEITHGFDDQGRQFDEKGNLNSWWTDKDVESFNQRAQVMVDQFNQYVVLDSMHVRGKACLGENIADLGGVILGYQAFQKTDQYKKGLKTAGFTPDQRFFLGYALGWLHQQRPEQLAKQIMTDVHAPANLRVNGPLSNFEPFYKAFGIKPTDPIYRDPTKRVQIW